ncbi:hypothetical protein EV200_104383 [Pedobacter psychrotolerans]|uniref:Uncharacterized protein n=1 Tax=Pedobacter psychrotolerans TaxID=1843235 RepID=A0A4V2RZE4_9SPHI|nr:hypothetical protein [Pedobacter psychrotolerans]TCO25345.1 hypothetical protein EV200_104383 [Pedobacter psychrotolerans]GGE46257.1 hypothetical protein GCM10011413_10410 [Pedobacter psychrotolerans]
MKFIPQTPDLDLLVPSSDTVKFKRDKWLENSWFPDTTIIVKAKFESTHPFFGLINQISINEFIFLKTSFQAISMQVDYLHIEMEKIKDLVGKQVKTLKKRLILLQEILSKIEINHIGISIEAVKTSNEILTIQYEINNLYHHKKYNLLSDRLSRVSITPIDTLEENELANLIRLGLLEKILPPFTQKRETETSDNDKAIGADLNVNQSMYGYSKLGLAFMKACEQENRRFKE